MSILKQESEVTTKVGRIMYKVVCNSLLKLAAGLIQQLKLNGHKINIQYLAGVVDSEDGF